MRPASLYYEYLQLKQIYEFQALERVCGLGASAAWKVQVTYNALFQAL